MPSLHMAAQNVRSVALNARNHVHIAIAAPPGVCSLKIKEGAVGVTVALLGSGVANL